MGKSILGVFVGWAIGTLLVWGWFVYKDRRHRKQTVAAFDAFCERQRDEDLRGWAAAWAATRANAGTDRGEG